MLNTNFLGNLNFYLKILVYLNEDDWVDKF